MTRAIIIAIIAAIWVYLIGAFIAWDWGWAASPSEFRRTSAIFAWVVMTAMQMKMPADPQNRAADGKVGQK
jgi:hypothetical protein